MLNKNSTAPFDLTAEACLPLIRRNRGRGPRREIARAAIIISEMIPVRMSRLIRLNRLARASGANILQHESRPAELVHL